MYQAKIVKLRSKNHREEDMVWQNGLARFWIFPEEGVPFNTQIFANKETIPLNHEKYPKYETVPKGSIDQWVYISGIVTSPVVAVFKESFPLTQEELEEISDEEGIPAQGYVTGCYFHTENTTYYLYNIEDATEPEALS